VDISKSHKTTVKNDQTFVIKLNLLYALVREVLHVRGISEVFCVVGLASNDLHE
jgi:hypothetical protein